MNLVCQAHYHLWRPLVRRAVLLLTTMAILNVTPSAHALERVRVALSVRNVVFLPFYYAKNTKIYDKYGLDVELIQMRSDLPVAGLVSGEIDYTPAAGPAANAIASGLPLKALAVLYFRNISTALMPAASFPSV